MFIDIDEVGNARFNIPGNEVRLCNKTELFSNVVKGKADSFLRSFVITTLSAVDIQAKNFEGDAVSVALSEDSDVLICILHDQNQFFVDQKCVRIDVPLSAMLYATKNALATVNAVLKDRLDEDTDLIKDEELLSDDIEEDDDDTNICNAYMLSSRDVWDFIKFARINNVLDEEIVVLQDERDERFFSYILTENYNSIPLICREYFNITKVDPALILVEEHNHAVGTLKQLAQF